MHQVVRLSESAMLNLFDTAQGLAEKLPAGAGGTPSSTACG